jgi:MoxR-like ATPase
MVNGLLMGILAGGHVLVEGVPGLAKTLAVRTLADVIDVGFKRLQFTPDLLPADLIGTMVYRRETGEFVPRKGPVFTNIVLADEINRAPAKVQSALLEAMEERQVTLGESSHPLPDPFFVMATQNPIEQEGTYPLPEAELDRFLLKLTISYPSKEEELAILKRMGNSEFIPVSKRLAREDLGLLRAAAQAIHLDDRLMEYITAIVLASRSVQKGLYPFSRYLEYGASPRAAIALYRCSRIEALFQGRSYVLPEDIKAVACNVLRHRLILSYEAESEELSPEDIAGMILKEVPVP